MNMDVPIEYQLDDAPERRWNRAVRLFDSNQRPAQYDDAVTVAALRLCRRLRDQRRCARTDSPEFAAIFRAHELFVSDESVRWEIEGWLIAGLSPDAVSATMRISADVVQWFGDVFFDVTSHLGDRTWIGRHVLLVGQQMSDVSERQMWREAAVAGPAMLELLMDDYHGRLTDNPGDHQVAERFRNHVQFNHVPLDDKPLLRKLIAKTIASLQQCAPHINPIVYRQTIDAALRLAATEGIAELVEPSPLTSGIGAGGFAGDGMLSLPLGFRPLLGPLACLGYGAAVESPKRSRRRARAPKREPEAPVCTAGGELQKRGTN